MEEMWAIVELMGHRRLAGRVSEVEAFGTKMLRIDIPKSAAIGDAEVVTQFYGGPSIYGVSPVSEDVARAAAMRNQQAPVSPWEMPKQPLPIANDDDDDRVDIGGEDSDDDF